MNKKPTRPRASYTLGDNPEDQLDQFIADRKTRGIKELSITTYRQRITPFLAFAKGKNPRECVAEYLQKFKSEATKKTEWRHIKTFAVWCYDQGLCEDWTHGLKFRFAQPAQTPVLSVEEFEKIMAAIPKKREGRRNRALFYVMFYTGARRMAILTLRREDVNIADRVIKIHTKRSKEEFLNLPPVAAEVLKAWLESSKRIKSPWAFPLIKNPEKHADARYVTRALPRYARAAGFTRRVYPHLLRHSYASILYESGCSMEVIQAALGHSSLQMTANYVRRLNDNKRVRAAVDVVFGGAPQASPAPRPVTPSPAAPPRAHRPAQSAPPSALRFRKFATPPEDVEGWL